MGIFKALKFYVGAALEASGLTESAHLIPSEELYFAEFAISHSTRVVDCGPRLDTELVAIALRYNAEITLFEASPIFARKLKKSIKAMVRQADIVTVVNQGVSYASGSLRYYFLNQSFVKNVPYRTYWFGRNVEVTSLDEYFIGRNYPDFIKSDVEGLDLEVFRGAQEILRTMKYFQLEMVSTAPSNYEELFQDFDLFILLSKNHPLRLRAGAEMFTPVSKLGWEKIFASMLLDETNILCGVRKGAPVPNF